MRWGYQGLALEPPTTACGHRRHPARRRRRPTTTINAKATIVWPPATTAATPTCASTSPTSLRNLAWAHGSDRTNIVSTGCAWAATARASAWSCGPGRHHGGRPARAVGRLNGKPGLAFGGCGRPSATTASALRTSAYQARHRRPPRNAARRLDLMRQRDRRQLGGPTSRPPGLRPRDHGPQLRHHGADEVRDQMTQLRDRSRRLPRARLPRPLRLGVHQDVRRRHPRGGRRHRRLDEEATANFVAEVAHWNEMCEAGEDNDWGIDPSACSPSRRLRSSPPSPDHRSPLERLAPGRRHLHRRLLPGGDRREASPSRACTWPATPAASATATRTPPRPATPAAAP